MVIWMKKTNVVLTVYWIMIQCRTILWSSILCSIVNLLWKIQFHKKYCMSHLGFVVGQAYTYIKGRDEVVLCMCMNLRLWKWKSDRERILECANPNNHPHRVYNLNTYLQLLLISSSYICFQALVLPFLPPIGFAMMVAKYLPIFIISILQALPFY